MSRVLLGVFISLCFLSKQANSQSYGLSEEQTVTVTGTSTLHDWKVTVSDVDGFPTQLDLSQPISEFTFSAAVNSMDGGRGASMNGKIQKALKSDIHPNITFSQSGESSPSKTNGNEIAISIDGQLFIAGNEKNITLSIEGIIENDKLILSGSYPLTMSEFEIDPPSAMFGQIQTNDEVEVQFEVIFLKQ